MATSCWNANAIKGLIEFVITSSLIIKGYKKWLVIVKLLARNKTKISIIAKFNDFNFIDIDIEAVV
jgi:hypothetical protein